MVEKMCCEECLHQTVCRYWLAAKDIMEGSSVHFTFHCDNYMGVKSEAPKRTPRKKAKA